MRARGFTLLIATMFVLSIIVASQLVMMGYGLPLSYESIYFLDSYNILVGVSREAGKPIIYEWDMVTLLKPGNTRISIRVGTTTGAERLGNVSITLTMMGKKYVSHKPLLNITIHRNTIFFVARIMIEINNPHTTKGIPLASVSLRVRG